MKHQEEDSLLALQVKIERWVKKNRTKLVITAGVIVVWLASFAIWNVIEENRLTKANEALNALIIDPQNESAKAELQAKSPELYDLFLFSKAVRSGDLETLKTLANKATIIGDLASYQVASLQADGAQLASYSQKEGATLKDFAALQEAFLLLQNGKDGTNALAKIGLNSELKSAANALEHYRVR